MTVTTSAVPTAAYENPGPANKAEPPRDYWGRYRLPHPNDENGKQYGFQRVTTFAKVLDDTYNLDRWKTRQTVLGLLKRPDLLALAATITEPDSAQGKKDLDEICEKAQEAAGTSIKANLGSALHGYCDQLLSGASGDTIPQQFHADLLAYRRELSRVGIVELPYYAERVVFNEHFDVSGRFDRIVQLPDGTLAILDIKTRDGDLDLSWSSIAVQLATYAHAGWIRNYETSRWERMPNVRKDIALVVHLPVGRGEAHVYQVNITAGWWGARAAAEGQAWRKVKHLAAPFIPEHTPKPLEHPTPEQIEAGRQPTPQVPINPTPEGAVDPFAAQQARVPDPGGTAPAADPFVAASVPVSSGSPSHTQDGWLPSPQEVAAAIPPPVKDPFAGIPTHSGIDPFAQLPTAVPAGTPNTAVSHMTAENGYSQWQGRQQPDPAGVDFAAVQEAISLDEQFVATAHVGYDASGTEWKFGPGISIEQAKANGIVWVDKIPLVPGATAPTAQNGGSFPPGTGATADQPGPVGNGRVAWSSAKQANISLNADGSENATAFVKPHEFQGNGLHCGYCSLGSGDTRANHLKPAEQPAATGHNDSEAFTNAQNTGDPYTQGPPRPANEQPEKRGPGRPAKPPIDPKTASAEELATLPKAKLQDLLRGLDSSAVLARQRKNLAADIVRLRDAMQGGTTAPPAAEFSATVSNAPGPVPPDPTPQYAAGAPVLDEAYYLGQIQLAQTKKDLSTLWNHAKNNGIPWTEALHNAGIARMRSVTE